MNLSTEIADDALDACGLRRGLEERGLEGSLPIHASRDGPIRLIVAATVLPFGAWMTTIFASATAAEKREFPVNSWRY